MAFPILRFGDSAFNQLWDDFVLHHAEAWAGHLSANFALAEAGQVRNHSFLILNGNGQVRAAMPLFETAPLELRFFKRRVLSSGIEFPAHPLTDAPYSSRQGREILGSVMETIETIAASCGADDVRISIPTIIDGVTAVNRYSYSPLRHYGFEDDCGVGWIVDLRPDVDELNRTLEKSCRNMIRRATKEGCIVRSIKDRDEWVGCYDLAQRTLGTLSPSARSHAAVWDAFIAPGYAATHVIASGPDGGASNIVVSVGWNRDWYYWKSYNDRSSSVPGANNLAVWSAMVAAKEAGGAFFQVGSMEFANKKQVAISEFKASFGGSPTYLLRGVRHRRPIRHAGLSLLAAGYAQWLARRSAKA